MDEDESALLDNLLKKICINSVVPPIYNFIPFGPLDEKRYEEGLRRYQQHVKNLEKGTND